MEPITRTLNPVWRLMGLSLILLMAALNVSCLVAPGPLAQAEPAPTMEPAPYPTQLPGPPEETTVSAPVPASRWPMVFDTPQGPMTIYQPQLTSFDGNHIAGRSAISVLEPGTQEPIFGAIWMQSRVSVDRVSRTVQILDVNVTQVKFPDADEPTAQAVTAALQSVLPGQPMHMSLDQLLAQVQVIEKQQQAAAEIDNQPPQIVFKTNPSVLVQYDGQPRFSQAPNSPLFRADNTPFFVALDPQTQTYYLKGDGRWFVAPQPLGPFHYVPQVPAAIAQVAIDSGYKDPPTTLTEAQAAQVEIVSATAPTELIWTDGREQMSPIAGTNLLYVSNTDSDVFLQIETQTIYVLLSGRWYSSPSRSGPWTFVPSEQLPADFRLIGPTSEKANVLAFVAGTQQASDAVADAYIPQTAAVDRDHYDQPTVQYDGGPQFQPIEGTPMSYAVNTPSSVLLVDNQYYCCSSAVWYVSRGPVGPWALCISVPQVIYTMPPTCPLYPCRWVYVYEATPQVVYVGYLPGYVGCYPIGGVVVYGTGYHYNPWIGHNYYARPFTWGFAAHYDAYSGQWGDRVGFHAGEAVGWFGDRTGPIARRGGWFGHGGYRPTYDHRDLDQIHRSIPLARPEIRHDDVDLYQRRKDIVPAYHAPAARDAHEVAQPHPVAPPPAEVRRNDVLADEHGNAYRRSVDGWEMRQGNKWVPANPPQQPKSVEPPQREQPRHEAPPTPPKPPETPHVPTPVPPPHRDTPAETPHNVAPAPKPAEPKQAEPKPAELKPAEPKPAEPKPAEPKQAEPKPAEPKPAEPKPAEPKQAEPKPAEPKPAEPKPAEPKPAEPKSPPAKSGGSGLNQDFQARVHGDQRPKAYPTPPPAPPPPPAHPAPPAGPKEPAPSPAPAAPANPGGAHGGGPPKH